MVAIAQEMKVTENRRDQEEMLPNKPPTLRPASSTESLQECPVRIADDPLRFRLQLTFAWLSQTHGMIAK
jgi:hypothetical protein